MRIYSKSYPSHSPIMLACIKDQLRNPVYSEQALLSLRRYYQKLGKAKVIELIDEEILNRRK